ncbi:MAG TPA: TnsA-like heteromeric transposase endonuclease subunit [Streptosporangiaceae bacterium]|nr:TnsA-like heteromeric transposase endonuclease subunit [Streptosporangiaceae bacterium]
MQVVFVDEAGARQSGALEVLWSTGFEHVSPVRSFGSFRGQRSFQGSWWFATTGEHVGFESWAERDVVMLLDFDPDVVAVSSQPFWLSWAGRPGARRHVPDFFARLADGSAMVIDVRPDELVGADDAEVFAATQRACAAVGWGYRRAGVVDAVLAANVRWLSGFRHRRCESAPAGGELVRRVAAGPVTVADLAGGAGDRLAVLPVLYHLLWRGVLAADLAAAPLSGRTVVRAGRAA